MKALGSQYRRPRITQRKRTASPPSTFSVLRCDCLGMVGGSTLPSPALPKTPLILMTLSVPFARHSAYLICNTLSIMMIESRPLLPCLGGDRTDVAAGGHRLLQCQQKWLPSADGAPRRDRRRDIVGDSDYWSWAFSRSANLGATAEKTAGSSVSMSSLLRTQWQVVGSV